VERDKLTPKSGEERFHLDGKYLDFNLLSFWQWSSSEILGNALRGILAEYIVAIDIGCDSQVREEWDAYDLVTPDGVTVEVKSAAYLQSWKQTKLSALTFNIQPTKAWYASTNSWGDEYKRQADVYVFCVLSHKDKSTVDPLNLSQWDFYVLTTKELNKQKPNQKTIALSSLLKLNPITSRFGEVGESIKHVCG